VKTSLAHLPADKQADIARIVLLIRKFVADFRASERASAGQVAPTTDPAPGA
jgi:hypothetical protein